MSWIVVSLDKVLNKSNRIAPPAPREHLRLASDCQVVENLLGFSLLDAVSTMFNYTVRDSMDGVLIKLKGALDTEERA
jgi:hypothetical protein